jgi:hypothetical protein
MESAGSGLAAVPYSDSAEEGESMVSDFIGKRSS